MAMKCDCDNKFPNHEKELVRLNRAAGQLEGAKKMIVERRYCPDILTLLKGVRSAIKAVESNILKSHLESCIAYSFEPKERSKRISEIKEILDRFQQ